MRALILWSDPDSTNLGVRTLARGTAALIERTFGQVETATQGFGPGDAPVRIGRWQAHARRLLRHHDELVDWVRGFDLVVDTRAGDSFSDLYGMPRHATMTMMAEVVRRSRVPLVLGPQTIGPFESRLGRAFAKRSLRTSRLAFARDSISAGVARELGRPADLLTTDVVFALDTVDVPITRDIVFNPSGLLWNENPHVDYREYRKIVADVCNALIASGRRVSLLAHVLDSPLVDNDVVAVNELAGRLDESVERLVPAGLDDVRLMLASAQLVLGSRMHACLNAISLGRPAVPLAYSRKFGPLLAGIGWKHTLDLRNGDNYVGSVLAAADDHSLASEVLDVRARADAQIAEAGSVLERAV